MYLQYKENENKVYTLKKKKEMDFAVMPSLLQILGLKRSFCLSFPNRWDCRHNPLPPAQNSISLHLRTA
jgi:hypothetical protein